MGQPKSINRICAGGGRGKILFFLFHNDAIFLDFLISVRAKEQAVSDCFFLALAAPFFEKFGMEMPEMTKDKLNIPGKHISNKQDTFQRIKFERKMWKKQTLLSDIRIEDRAKRRRPDVNMCMYTKDGIVCLCVCALQFMY